MNLSGKAVKEILSNYRIDEYMIIFDDINLELGQIRLRNKGSDGGHNGIKSIISETMSAEFIRFRVGIDNNLNSRLSDYVLSKFDETEEKVMEETVKYSINLIEEFIFSNYKNVLNKFSKSKKSYSEKIDIILESSDQRRKTDE